MGGVGRFSQAKPSTVLDFTGMADCFSRTLTSSVGGDDITGTSSDDTFVAATSLRLQDADVLDGGAGNDTLTAKLNSATAHDATINAIETINFELLGDSTITGSLITGEKTVNVTGEAVLTYTGGTAGVAYSVGGTAGLTLTQSGTDSTSDAVTVTLNTGKVGTLTLGATTGVDFETINLVVAGATTATLTEDTNPTFADSGDKVVVTGSGDITLSIAHAALGANATAGSQTAATIDASGHTGKLTLDIGTDNTNDNISAEKWTGVDVIKIKTGSSDTDIITKVASGTEVIVNDQEAVQNTLTVSPNGSATTDALTITLNNSTAGSKIDLTGLVIDGFEDFTLNSTGTNSSSTVVSNVIDDIAGLSTDTKLTISGDKALTATGIESTFTTITVTNTAGADLTVDAGGALKFTGGTGDDRLALATIADITSADVLKGGDGVNTFAITSATELENADFTATQIAAISNFQTIEFTGAQDLTATDTNVARSFDLTKFTGVNKLIIGGALTTDAADTLTIVANNNFTLALGGAVVATTNYVDVQIANSSAAGTNDTVTLALNKESAGASLAIAGVTIDNVENLNIQVKGVQATSDIITVSDIDGAQLQRITLSSTAGNNSDGTAKAAESLTITTVETTLLSTFDASAYTGVLTITGLSTKYTATGATVIGGAGVDNITGGVGADVITGGKGADVLVGDTGDDNIDGGIDNDAITGGVGADVLTGGAGTDTFTIAIGDSATLAVKDRITDFSALASDQAYDILNTVGNISVTPTTTAATLQSAATATDVTGATTETDTGTVLGAITAAGKITVSGTSVSNVDTLAEYLAVARIMLDSQGAGITSGTTASSIGFFEYSGNSYVVEETTTDVGGTETVTANVIELTGVTGITGLATSAAAGYIVFA
jgi:S-layer protein